MNQDITLTPESTIVQMTKGFPTQKEQPAYNYEQTILEPVTAGANENSGRPDPAHVD